MAEAKRDQNMVTTLIGVSSADGVTPVVVYVDPDTHRVLVTSASTPTPAGNDTEVQFNDGGSMGADAGMTYNKTTNVLTVGGAVIGALSGLLKATAGTVSAASAGTDYQAPLTFGIANTNAVIIDSADVADNDFAKFTANGLEGRSYSEVKTDLGLVIGTNVQAYSSILGDIVGLTPASSLMIGNGAGSWTVVTPATFISNNNIATTTNSISLTNKTIDVDNNTVSNIETDNLKSVSTFVSELKIKKIVSLKVIADGTALTTGDGKMYFTVPSDLNGMNLVDVDAAVYTVSSSGAPTVQIHNLTDTVDMLSTAITIDASEYSSYTAATQPVIDTAHDDVATGDRIRIDVDGAGTGTAGLEVILVFQSP